MTYVVCGSRAEYAHFRRLYGFGPMHVMAVLSDDDLSGKWLHVGEIAVLYGSYRQLRDWDKIRLRLLSANLPMLPVVDEFVQERAEQLVREEWAKRCEHEQALAESRRRLGAGQRGLRLTRETTERP